jgi:hypothetical protein
MNKNSKKQNTSTKSTSKLSTPTLFELSPIDKKPIEISFTAQHTSSDGGLLLLKEVESKIGIINSISNCINDDRHSSYISHSISSMISQRVFQIAAGYEDANDCDELKEDAVIKICAGKLPETSDSLASQPTMCRLENKPSARELYRIAEVFTNNFINSYSSEPSVIILDCDDTNVNAYGQQQEIEFNNYYGEYCFMPLHIYEGLSGKLITTILKPGRRSKTSDVYAILKRIIARLRQYWKNTVIIVRGDSHFCCKELMDWTSVKRDVHFITGLTGNSVLNKLSATTVTSAEREYAQYGKPIKRYHSFEYQAASWAYPQRVIVKVEVNSMGSNIRYIVTDMREYRAKELYEKGYCARGNMELRIKDHKLFLQSDRMSCNSFLANQFRLFLHSAAYVLLHTLQKEMFRGTEFFNVTLKTLQLKVIKVATKVKEMKTKIRIEFPMEFPVKKLFEKTLGMFELMRC